MCLVLQTSNHITNACRNLMEMQQAAAIYAPRSPSNTLGSGINVLSVKNLNRV